MTDETACNPITSVCIVADKNKVPVGFSAITKSYDDQTEADVWKDGFFSLFRVYRYISVCKTIPENAFILNVVADICIVAERELIPDGFVPIEYTEDTTEKALRKKLLCIRTVPRETAIDAVSQIIILSSKKKPPNGYSLAGELDGLLVCYKYDVIPDNFGLERATQQTQLPIYPSTDKSTNSPSIGTNAAPGPWTMTRQASKGVDGVPFQLNPFLEATFGSTNLSCQLPDIQPISELHLEREFTYHFQLERTTIGNCV